MKCPSSPMKVSTWDVHFVDAPSLSPLSHLPKLLARQFRFLLELTCVILTIGKLRMPAGFVLMISTGLITTSMLLVMSLSLNRELLKMLMRPSAG
jgi:hypothetical protein